MGRSVADSYFDDSIFMTDLVEHESASTNVMRGLWESDFNFVLPVIVARAKNLKMRDNNVVPLDDLCPFIARSFEWQISGPCMELRSFCKKHYES